MTKKTPLILLFLAATGSLIWAQPPDFAVYPGDEERGPRDRGQAERLAKMVDYLELSESQAAEWEAMTQEHMQATRARWEHIGSLRESFRDLAEQENPNLEEAGRIALEMHREMETARSSRGQVFEDLQQILTPEQADKLEALKTAREFSGRRGDRGRGPRRDRDRPDGS